MAHPRVIAALAAGDVVSESYARTICGWTGKLPGACQQAADAILVAAAEAGADLAGLAELAAEIYARSLPVTGDDEDGETFEDRSVRVETTFAGAGVSDASLIPVVTGAVDTTVLDDLVQLCVQLSGHDHRCRQAGPDQDPGPGQDTPPDRARTRRRLRPPRR